MKPFQTVVRAGLLVAGLAVPLSAQTVDDRPPTPIEQALMEYACRVPGQAMPTVDVYETCLRAQLVTLRTDFGVDLQRLSAAERRTIDKTCSAVRTDRGRDAYVGCMNGQLVALRSKRAPAKGANAAVTAAPAEAPASDQPDAGAVVASAAPVDTAPVVPARSSAPLWLGFGALLAVAGGAWLFLRPGPKRAVVHLCKVCGADTGEGDLCANCRHDAADSQRRALAERAEQQRQLELDARRAQEDAEARRLQAEDESRRAQEAAGEAERERQREAARQREEETRRWQQAAAAAIAGPVDDATIDPYAVLGIPQTATADDIKRAYAEASAKYAPDQVAHLGQELQDHYRSKSKAVEGAFELLTAPART